MYDIMLTWVPAPTISLTSGLVLYFLEMLVCVFKQCIYTRGIVPSRRGSDRFLCRKADMFC